MLLLLLILLLILLFILLLRLLLIWLLIWLLILLLMAWVLRGHHCLVSGRLRRKRLLGWLNRSVVLVEELYGRIREDHVCDKMKDNNEDAKDSVNSATHGLNECSEGRCLPGRKITPHPVCNDVACTPAELLDAHGGRGGWRGQCLGSVLSRAWLCGEEDTWRYVNEEEVSERRRTTRCTGEELLLCD